MKVYKDIDVVLMRPCGVTMVGSNALKVAIKRTNNTANLINNIKKLDFKVVHKSTYNNVEIDTENGLMECVIDIESIRDEYRKSEGVKSVMIGNMNYYRCGAITYNIIIEYKEYGISEYAEYIMLVYESPIRNNIVNMKEYRRKVRK